MAWINPRYAELAGREPPGSAGGAQSSPPIPTGQELARILRPKHDGGDDVLRIALDSFEGHPYVAIRVFNRDRDGNLWPVRNKGLSVRVGELAQVAEALRRAERIADASRALASPPAGARSRGGRRHRQAEGPTLPLDRTAEVFDEFGPPEESSRGS